MIVLALVYVGLAVLVCASLAAHRVKVAARAVVIVAAPALAFAVYFAARPPTGWPATVQPSADSQLVWGYVQEPDVVTHSRGEIDLWVIPPGATDPRAVRVPYSRKTHRALAAALAAAKQGVRVAVRMQGRKPTEPGPKVRPQFYRMPPPQLPEKGNK